MINWVQAMPHISFRSPREVVLSVAVLAWLRALGLGIPFGLPFWNTGSQGMAT